MPKAKSKTVKTESKTEPKTQSKTESKTESKSKSKTSDLDIQLDLYDYIPHGKFQKGIMRVIFRGEDANSQFINSIGRIMMDRVPTYAFVRDLVKVERINPESGYHDSVAINHDMITQNMSFVPVSNVDPGISYLHEKYWRNVDYLDETREIPEESKHIELSLDVRNDTDSMLDVTSNDMIVHIDGAKAELFDKDFPLQFIKLKRGEQIRLSARAVIGIGFAHSCWQAASNFAIDQETEPDSTILMFQSASRFNEYMLMFKALEYFKIRLNITKKQIIDKYLANEEKTEKFIVLIDGEDWTIGTPLAYELQSHPKAMYASCGMPDNLVDQIKIMVIASEADNITEIIEESFERLQSKIDVVKTRFDEIYKETYSKYLDKDGKSKFYDYDQVRHADPVA